MLSSLALTALLGLGVSAAPTADSAHHSPSGYGGGSQGQVAFKFPLENGFPNIKVPSAALTAIEKQAHGTLPNGALPKKISDASATTLQVIAFNEIFEVAYFTTLLKNITSGGYDAGKGEARAETIRALKAVQAQEQLHALGANAILSSAGRTPIKPCEYIFPVDSFSSAVATASEFTDIVLGALQDAQNTFATTGDSELVPLVGAIIGQEGEQDGYYRSLGKKIPSALPFLTGAAGPFAYSALNQLFIVPGSCPNANVINAPILPALTVATQKIKAKDQTLKFSVKKTANMADMSKASVVYINQQNTPIVEKIQNVQVQGNTVSFEAAFPGETNLMNGLTIAAVTSSAGPFSSVDDVANAAKYGPGLIEIN